MKLDASFKLSKDTKRVLATFTDKEQRAQFKKIMLDAESTYERNKKRKQSASQNNED
jgi:hypothetical protein